MSNISKNRDKKLGLTVLAKLAIPRKLCGGLVYTLDEPVSDNLKDLVNEATAYYIPYSTTTGVIMDFSNWHNVKFYDVRSIEGIYFIEKETHFHINRGNARLKRSFLFKTIEGDIIERQLEIYKSELMFIGAMNHANEVLYYLDQRDELSYDLINIEMFNKIYKGYLNKYWGDSEYSGEQYVIKSTADKDTNDMADIAMIPKIKKGQTGEIAVLRLTEGPVILKGHIPLSLNSQFDFDIDRIRRLRETHTIQMGNYLIICPQSLEGQIHSK